MNKLVFLLLVAPLLAHSQHLQVLVTWAGPTELRNNQPISPAEIKLYTLYFKCPSFDFDYSVFFDSVVLNYSVFKDCLISVDAVLYNGQRSGQSESLLLNVDPKSPNLSCEVF